MSVGGRFLLSFGLRVVVLFEVSGFIWLVGGIDVGCYVYCVRKVQFSYAGVIVSSFFDCVRVANSFGR